MQRKLIILSLSVLAMAAWVTAQDKPKESRVKKEQPAPKKITKTDAEWKEQLSPDQYHILREQGTERAYTGIFWDHKELGTYRCAACSLTLFQSDVKFDSGCGWPSFFIPARKNAVTYREDRSLGTVRTEVNCGACGGHLGHVFKDGPKPTGLRYCINSGSLTFEAAAASPIEQDKTPTKD